MGKKLAFIMGTVAISAFLFLCLTDTNGQNSLTDPETDGYVPNAETAIKVAEAVWLPIYGNEIYENKPFKARLKNDSIWIVEGTLNRARGGVPYVEIQRADCKILNVYHGK